MEFLLDLPNRVFLQIAGYKNMYSGALCPIPDYETEDQPSLQDGWSVEDALRLHDLCALLSALNERERDIALNAVFLSNPRFFSVLKHEYGDI